MGQGWHRWTDERATPAKETADFADRADCNVAFKHGECDAQSRAMTLEEGLGIER